MKEKNKKSNEAEVISFRLFVRIFGKEILRENFEDIGSFWWIFVQSFVEELDCFLRKDAFWWYADFVFDDFGHLFLSGDFKGVLADQHFVGHDAEWPDVNFFIVFFSL